MSKDHSGAKINRDSFKILGISTNVHMLCDIITTYNAYLNEYGYFRVSTTRLEVTVRWVFTSMTRNACSRSYRTNTGYLVLRERKDMLHQGV